MDVTLDARVLEDSIAVEVFSPARKDALPQQKTGGIEESMAGRSINSLVWIGLTGTFFIGSSFFADLNQAFRGNSGIWWTHDELRLPLEETKNDVEVYISGKLLQKHITDETLTGMDGNGKPYIVVSRDVVVRLNNMDKIRASILTRTTVSGLGLGVSLTLLVTGLIQVFRRRARKD
jgi:hypothetical protein